MTYQMGCPSEAAKMHHFEQDDKGRYRQCRTTMLPRDDVVKKRTLMPSLLSIFA